MVKEEKMPPYTEAEEETDDDFDDEFCDQRQYMTDEDIAALSADAGWENPDDIPTLEPEGDVSGQEAFLAKRWQVRDQRKDTEDNVHKEYQTRENLEKYRQAIEERYGRDFFEVMSDALTLKFSLTEMAELLYLFAAKGRGQKVDEEKFLQSYVGVSLEFTLGAIRTIAEAVKSGGKTPIIWRIGALCRW